MRPTLRSEWHGPLVAGASVAALAIVSLLIDAAPYRWVFGIGQPALPVLLLIVLGAPCLVSLDRSGLFAFNNSGDRKRGLFAAIALAGLFAALVVLVDVVVGFPQTYNVPPRLPESLLFYPAIAYVAEMAFHAIPLAVLVALSAGRVRVQGNDTLLRLGMVAIACLEPAYQLQSGLSGGAADIAWTELFVVMHVFAINLVQLGLFRQFDFLTAYLFRVVYYVLWHIAWGDLRQVLLF